MTIDAPVDSGTSSATIEKRPPRAADEPPAPDTAAPNLEDTNGTAYLEPPLYEIRPSPTAGLGLFAARPIPAGTRILSDPPLLSIPTGYYTASDVSRALAAAPPAARTAFEALHSAHGLDAREWEELPDPKAVGAAALGALGVPRVKLQHGVDLREARTGRARSPMSVFATNCVEMGGGVAVFGEVSRINHACAPNAAFAWNEALGRETVHAVRGIARGEEVTISYCDPFHGREMRRWLLRQYGFQCRCALCEPVGEGAARSAAQSEDRRFRLRQLEDEMAGIEAKCGEQAEVEVLVREVETAALMLEDGLRTEELGRV